MANVQTSRLGCNPRVERVCCARIGAQPIPKLTAEQLARVNERDTAQAELLASCAKWDYKAAIPVAERVLAAERKLFGDYLCKNSVIPKSGVNRHLEQSRTAGDVIDWSPS